jgi:predicted dienelactone hydrolase
MNTWFLRVAPVLTLSLMQATPVVPPTPGPPIVGMVTREYVDPSRMNWSRTGPRPLRTAIWYPVDAVRERETIFDAPAAEQLFVPVEVAAGEQPSHRSHKFQLVVMSHGTGGSAIMMMWLGSHLAANGYIVAAVNHHGNTAAEKELAVQGFLLYWERATDLEVLIDALLAWSFARCIGAC